MALRSTLLAVVLLWLSGIIHAQIATTTALTSVTPAAPLFGQTVTLTAQVVPIGAPGAVSFMDGGVLVGVGTVNKWQPHRIATCKLPRPGTHLVPDFDDARVIDRLHEDLLGAGEAGREI